MSVVNPPNVQAIVAVYELINHPEACEGAFWENAREQAVEDEQWHTHPYEWHSLKHEEEDKEELLGDEGGTLVEGLRRSGRRQEGQVSSSSSIAHTRVRKTASLVFHRSDQPQPKTRIGAEGGVTQVQDSRMTAHNDSAELNLPSVH